jgi:hypothetical protein
MEVYCKRCRGYLGLGSRFDVPKHHRDECLEHLNDRIKRLENLISKITKTPIDSSFVSSSETK